MEEEDFVAHYMGLTQKLIELVEGMPMHSMDKGGLLTLLMEAEKGCSGQGCVFLETAMDAMLAQHAINHAELYEVDEGIGWA